jgi:hypothetical protein
MSNNMLTTTFHNDTGETFELKEGNAGVYTHLTTLKDGKTFDVTFDPNATYREYWVGSTTKGMFVTITTDDCTDNDHIKVMKGGGLDKSRRSPHPKGDAKHKKQWWHTWLHSTSGS